MSNIAEHFCNCICCTPTYPEFRNNIHFPECPNYKPEPNKHVSTLAQLIGATPNEFNSMRYEAQTDTVIRRLKAVTAIVLELEIICRENPDNLLTTQISTLLRQHTRLFPLTSGLPKT